MVLTSALPSPSLDSSPVLLTAQSPGQATYNLSCVALSSTEAELIALTDAVRQAVLEDVLYNRLERTQPALIYMSMTAH